MANSGYSIDSPITYSYSICVYLALYYSLIYSYTYSHSPSPSFPFSTIG